jgi:hypothetical protein
VNRNAESESELLIEKPKGLYEKRPKPILRS